jgi:hypothetical protein
MVDGAGRGRKSWFEAGFGHFLFILNSVGIRIKVAFLIAVLTDASDEIQFQELQQLMVQVIQFSCWRTNSTSASGG